MKRAALRVAIGFAVAASLPCAVAMAAGEGFPYPANDAELQAQIDEQLSRTVGGVQVDKNTVWYEDGAVQLHFPLPEDAASADMEASDPLGALDAPPEVVPPTTTPGDDHGCPTSPWYGSNDWYCFYDGFNYTGRRLQYRDCSRSGTTQYFSTYDFYAQTSSWINTTTGKEIQVFVGNTLLWTEQPKTKVKKLGTRNNNRAQRFTCRN